MIADTMTETRPPLSPTEEGNLEAVAAVLEYWNTQDIEGILSFYDDDIVWTNVAVEEVYNGKQEVREFLHRLITAFPDLTFDVVQKFASGDDVSERWYIRGTHNGPFMGIPPTGRYCEIAGISMVRMRDGKFLSDWFMIDVMGSLRQMGIMPSMAATQSPLMRPALWAAVHKNVVAGVAGAGVVGTLAVRRIRKRG